MLDVRAQNRNGAVRPDSMLDAHCPECARLGGGSLPVGEGNDLFASQEHESGRGSDVHACEVSNFHSVVKLAELTGLVDPIVVAVRPKCLESATTGLSLLLQTGHRKGCSIQKSARWLSCATRYFPTFDSANDTYAMEVNAASEVATIVVANHRLI